MYKKSKEYCYTQDCVDFYNTFQQICVMGQAAIVQENMYHGFSFGTRSWLQYLYFCHFFSQLQKRVFFWGLWLPNFEKEMIFYFLFFEDPASRSKLQQDGMMFEFFYFYIF
jgi:hypothetical protein